MDTPHPSFSDETRTQIVTALYRGLLRREPDAEGLRAHLNAWGTELTLEGMVSAFLNSPELLAKLPTVINVYPLDGAPPVEVDADLSVTDRRILWEKVADAWSKLGEQDPFCSVLVEDRYQMDRMRTAEALDTFYHSGRNGVARMRAWLERNGCSIPADGTCVDYGCGVGRVTLWLAKTFRRVIAVDVSESHIRLAREYLGRKKIDNVVFQLLRGEEDLQVTRNADFFFSMIVLQHNPPPIIKSILTTVLAGMRACGRVAWRSSKYLPT